MARRKSYWHKARHAFTQSGDCPDCGNVLCDTLADDGKDGWTDDIILVCMRCEIYWPTGLIETAGHISRADMLRAARASGG